MDALDAIRANLLSPAILFFALGLFAAIVKSDLKLPEPVYVTLTTYLLVAIGFKGGVAISDLFHRSLDASWHQDVPCRPGSC